VGVVKVDNNGVRRWRWRSPLDVAYALDEFFDAEGFAFTRRGAFRAGRRQDRITYGQLGHSRWALAKFAIRQRGQHDDMATPGWWFPESFPDRLTWKAWLPRTWVVLMLAKLLVALAWNRRASIDVVVTESWCAAAGDTETFQGADGPIYSWTELRTPCGFRPSQWVFAVEREST